MTGQAAPERPQVSYLTLRCTVGFLGVALPAALAIWGYWLTSPHGLQDSISDYYSLQTRDLFVGTLWALAWFFFAYKGYDDQDDRVTDLACFLALGVAMAPNNGQGLVRIVHFASAAGLFLTLAYISFFLFTKSGGETTPHKQSRNLVYRACGIAMAVCISLIAVYYLLPEGNAFTRLKPVFWLEALSLWAFGISWFVKGKIVGFLNDPSPGGAAS